MILQSKSFFIGKGDSLQQVNSFIEKELGLDSYLIKDIQAVLLNDQTVQLTLLYNKYPTKIIDSVAPREGAIFTDGVSSNDFDIRFLFNYPIDFNSIVSGSFSIDDVGIPVDQIYTDSNSNGYFLKVLATGYQTQAFHTYKVSSDLLRSDGSKLSYTPVGGYIFHDLSSAYIGDYFSDYYSHRRGVTTIGLIRISKDRTAEQGIREFLAQQGLPDDRLIAFTSVARGTNLLDIYLVYLSKLEPQIVSGFPLNNSLLPDVSAPSKVTFVFNTDLDKSLLTTATGLFTIEEGFGTSTEVDPSYISLTDDLRTVEIDVSNYFTAQKVYSIIARPGLISLDGFEKIKPEQWTIHIAAYEAVSTGAGVADGSGADPNSRYLLYQSNASLPNSKVPTFANAITGYLTGSTYIFSGIGINEHFNNTSNPHNTTTAQIGAVDLSTFTGHTGQDSIHFTQASISIVSNQITDFEQAVTGLITGGTIAGVSNEAFTGHTGQTEIHFTQASISIPSAQITDFTQAVTGLFTGITAGVSADLFTGHTGDATIHFTQAQISIPSTQITDFTAAVTGLFTGITAGVSNDLFTGHTGNTSIHFTQAQISIPSSQISDFNSSVTGLFTGITSIGGLTNELFTGHTGDSSIHYSVGSIDHGSIAGLSDDDHPQYLLNDGSRVVSGELLATVAASSANAFARKNEVDAVDTYVFNTLVVHATDTSNPHVTTAAQVGAPTTAQFTGHTGDTTIHFTQAQIQITTGQITNFTSIVSGMIVDIATTGSYVSSSDFTSHTGNHSNPHSVTASQAGALSINNNFSDLTDITTARENIRVGMVIEDFAPCDFNGNFTTSNINAGGGFQGNPYYYTVTQAYDSIGVVVSSNNAGVDPTNGGLVVGNSTYLYLTSGIDYFFRIAVSHTGQAIFRFGLTNSNHLGTGFPSNGAYFEHNSNFDSLLHIVASSGSTLTSGSTADSLSANTWKWYAIGYYGSGINFYSIGSDGTKSLLGVHTKIPANDATRGMRPFIQTIGAGATYRNLYWDKFGYKMVYSGLPF